MNYPPRIALVNEEDVAILHEIAMKKTGGLPGIRDTKLVLSAINQPLMMLEFGDNEDKKLHSLAAIYFVNIIKNHPFVDGNKRTGLLTTIEFLFRNGVKLDMTDKELYELAVKTAASEIQAKEVAHKFQKALMPLL